MNLTQKKFFYKWKDISSLGKTFTHEHMNQKLEYLALQVAIPMYFVHDLKISYDLTPRSYVFGLLVSANTGNSNEIIAESNKIRWL